MNPVSPSRPQCRRGAVNATSRQSQNQFRTFALSFLLALLVPATVETATPSKTSPSPPRRDLFAADGKNAEQFAKISRFFLENRSQKRYTGNVEAARPVFSPRFPDRRRAISPAVKRRPPRIASTDVFSNTTPNDVSAYAQGNAQ
ncbi:MAG: hypothetical protein IJN32_03740 [Thermoguttaceae bacterium]|nr:hypothetical protein [Thermoguttaceae bacterium]